MAGHFIKHRMEEANYGIDFSGRLANDETIVSVLDLEIQLRFGTTWVDKSAEFLDPTNPVINDGKAIQFRLIAAPEGAQVAGEGYVIYARVLTSTGEIVVARDDNARLPRLVVIDGGKPAR